MIDSILNYLFSFNPVMIGIFLELIVVGFIISVYHYTRDKRKVLLTDIVFEKMYSFFEEILGKDFSRWIKSSVVVLFLVIVFANLLGVFLDIIIYIFPGLGDYVTSPTSNVHFTYALAVVSVLIMVFYQIREMGPVDFLHEYIPIMGKGIVDVDRGDKSSYIYRPLKVVVKWFDVFISLFLGFLDVIWLFAKVISLAFRLYGNMIAWSILIAMLIKWLNSLTQNIVGLHLPFLAPILLYLQSILIGVIQAFVFALLVAIFIKVAVADQY